MSHLRPSPTAADGDRDEIAAATTALTTIPDTTTDLLKFIRASLQVR
jgi:hypothetical protein